MQEADLRRILSALGVHVERTQASGWLEAQCPFAPFLHRSGQDRRPSFNAKVEAQGVSSYICHGCHMKGRISSLIRSLGHHRHGDKGHYKALSISADDADHKVAPAEWNPSTDDQYQRPESIAEEVFANAFAPVEAHDDAWSYIRDRRISLRTAESIGLRYDPRQRRVVFPVRGREGALYGFTGRAVRSDVSPKVRDYPGLGKRWHVLGADRWRHDEGRPIVIVEGLFGFAHLIEIGVEDHADVGALLGSEMTRQKADMIRQHAANTYLLVDNDAAGDACLWGRGNPPHGGAVDMLSGHLRVFVPEWPEGKDDPDQLTLAEVLSMLSDTTMVHSALGEIGPKGAIDSAS